MVPRCLLLLHPLHPRIYLSQTHAGNLNEKNKGLRVSFKTSFQVSLEIKLSPNCQIFLNLQIFLTKKPLATSCFGQYSGEITEFRENLRFNVASIFNGLPNHKSQCTLLSNLSKIVTMYVLSTGPEVAKLLDEFHIHYSLDRVELKLSESFILSVLLCILIEIVAIPVKNRDSIVSL